MRPAQIRSTVSFFVGLSQFFFIPATVHLYMYGQICVKLTQEKSNPYRTSNSVSHQVSSDQFTLGSFAIHMGDDILCYIGIMPK